jgi:hypothetical protein
MLSLSPVRRFRVQLANTFLRAADPNSFEAGDLSALLLPG